MTPAPLDTLGELEATLSALTGALARRDTAALLALEPRLALAADAAARIARPRRSEQAALAPAIHRAARALAHCEEVARASAGLTADLLACAMPAAYARTGVARPPAPPRELDARL